jgi:hypothetical protein
VYDRVQFECRYNLVHIENGQLCENQTIGGLSHIV